MRTRRNRQQAAKTSPSRRVQLAVLASLVVGTLAAAPVLASKQGTGLRVVPSPFVANSSLAASSVIASNDIWAVGSVTTGTSTTETLAEHFNGTGWSVVPTPSLNASFTGVAGAAEDDVWAIGSQASRKTENPLIEHWNGTSWSVVSTPKLPEGSQLRGVAAPATNDAWVVGFSGGSGALVEHWDGTSLTIVSSPAFEGVSGVLGISADSSSDVWALGGGQSSLHWNGQSWSRIPTARLRFGGVDAVSALSPTNVWAVGVGPGVPTGGFSAHPTALVEHWNGTNWSVVPSPNPAPQINNSLFSVAAVSANDVWAVGLAFGPFTEHWDGTSWSIVSTPSGLNALGGLSAAATGTVVAVGKENNSGVILSN